MSSSGSLPLTHKVLIGLENLLSRCHLSVLTNVLFVLAASLFLHEVFILKGCTSCVMMVLAWSLSLHGVCSKRLCSKNENPKRKYFKKEETARQLKSMPGIGKT